MSRPCFIRRVTVAFASAAVSLLTVFGVPAGSAPTTQSAVKAGTDAARAEVTSARSVERTLGAAAAGFYFDRSRGRMIVNVATKSLADEVRESGAVPRIVENSGRELARVTRALNKKVDLAGTAWGLDPRSNTVLVSMDKSVGAKEQAEVRSVTRRFSGKVTIERVAGRFTTDISGGQAILGGSGGRCSLGFNVRSGTTYYLLTAGHCTDVISTWYTSGGSYIGPTVGSSFPGNDYGIVRYDSSVTHPGTVYLYPGSQDITYAASAYVGQYVVRSGSTTGVHDGYVEALNVTVNYAEGTVSGLIQTDVCAEPGDSGGSLFSGSAAIGLTSGGSGNCWWGGTTFFQPVTEALGAYGVSVY